VKGLEINLIWIVLLAVLSVVVLIGMTTQTFQPLAYRLYCDVYLKIVGIFSHLETSSLPAYCKPNTGYEVQVVDINDQDNKIFSRNLLSYIISCWKETEIKENYKTHTCYELHPLKLVQDVTEESVTNILIKEDLCRSIENSDFGCGVMNQIIWNVDGSIINDQKIILIEYANETIRVIG